MRRNDWPERIASFVEESRRRAFAWGDHDCALVATAAVQRLTGVDPLARVRGTYATEDGADAVLGGLPLSLYMDAAMRAAGFLPVDPSLSQRGDVVIVEPGNMATCGVHLGGSVAVPGMDRLRFVPTRMIRAAWSV